MTCHFDNFTLCHLHPRPVDRLDILISTSSTSASSSHTHTHSPSTPHHALLLNIKSIREPLGQSVGSGDSAATAASRGTQCPCRKLGNQRRAEGIDRGGSENGGYEAGSCGGFQGVSLSHYALSCHAYRFCGGLQRIRPIEDLKSTPLLSLTTFTRTNTFP